MSSSKLLLTPGPVKLPEATLQALSRPLIHHRTEAFARLFERLLDGLKWIFQTEQPVLALSCSGTGAFEAVMTNFTRRGDQVVAVGGGKFGERWGAMASAHGLEVAMLEVEWGRCATPAALRELLRARPETKLVTLTHSETSTGALHPLKALLEVVREEAPEALLAVDAITSVGVHPVPMDEWGLDLVVSGSQKAFAAPPGMAFVAASQRAWERADQSDHGRYYFDLRRERDKQVDAAQTAFTPAISVALALDASLGLMRQSGLEALWARHAAHSAAVRGAIAALGCEVFAEVPSHGVTSIKLPEGVSAPALRATLRDEYDVVIAGGYASFKSNVVRFGHLGLISPGEVLTGLSALERALSAHGARFEPGAGLSAAQRVYAEGGAVKS